MAETNNTKETLEKPEPKEVDNSDESSETKTKYHFESLTPIDNIQIPDIYKEALSHALYIRDIHFPNMIRVTCCYVFQQIGYIQKITLLPD